MYHLRAKQIKRQPAGSNPKPIAVTESVGGSKTQKVSYLSNTYYSANWVFARQRGATNELPSPRSTPRVLRSPRSRARSCLRVNSGAGTRR